MRETQTYDQDLILDVFMGMETHGGTMSVFESAYMYFKNNEMFNFTCYDDFIIALSVLVEDALLLKDLHVEQVSDEEIEHITLRTLNQMKK